MEAEPPQHADKTKHDMRPVSQDAPEQMPYNETTPLTATESARDGKGATKRSSACFSIFLGMVMLLLLSPAVVFGLCIFYGSYDTSSQLIGLGMLLVVAVIVIGVASY